jgi:hypothetical protein
MITIKSKEGMEFVINEKLITHVRFTFDEKGAVDGASIHMANETHILLIDNYDLDGVHEFTPAEMRKFYLEVKNEKNNK